MLPPDGLPDPVRLFTLEELPPGERPTLGPALSPDERRAVPRSVQLSFSAAERWVYSGVLGRLLFLTAPGAGVLPAPGSYLTDASGVLCGLYMLYCHPN